MSETILPNGKQREWREREIHGGSTRAELAESARNRTWPDSSVEHSDDPILTERRRIAAGVMRLYHDNEISLKTMRALIVLVHKTSNIIIKDDQNDE